MLAPELAMVHPNSRAAWRTWLARHHASSPGVWFVYHKQGTGKRHVSYDEAVEEALCYGWVDSVPRVLDSERAMLRFTPRQAKSAWSAANKARVAFLIEHGLMAPAGLAKIEAAKSDGSWSALDAVEQLIVPEDLAHALAANPDAKRHFEAFPASSRKIILGWIEGAKRAETRATRVAETVRLAAENVRANHWHGPKTRAPNVRATPLRRPAG